MDLSVRHHSQPPSVTSRLRIGAVFATHSSHRPDALRGDARGALPTLEALRPRGRRGARAGAARAAAARVGARRGARRPRHGAPRAAERARLALRQGHIMPCDSSVVDAGPSVSVARGAGGVSSVPPRVRFAPVRRGECCVPSRPRSPAAGVWSFILGGNPPIVMSHYITCVASARRLNALCLAARKGRRPALRRDGGRARAARRGRRQVPPPVAGRRARDGRRGALAMRARRDA